MRFSESWLREWVNPDITTDELSHQLSMAGLEVDGVETAAPAFSGVVVEKYCHVNNIPMQTSLEYARSMLVVMKTCR